MISVSFTTCYLQRYKAVRDVVPGPGVAAPPVHHPPDHAAAGNLGHTHSQGERELHLQLGQGGPLEVIRGDNEYNYQVDKTVDKERESFIKHKEMFKTDQDPVRHRPHQRRQYVVSQVGTDSVRTSHCSTVTSPGPRRVELCREAGGPV